MALSQKISRGFTLTESVISLGVLGLIIPLILGLLVAGGETSQRASNETKAVFMARTIMQEVEAAREGRGELISGVLSWPSFPVDGGRLVFTANQDGLLLSNVATSDYETGVNLPSVSYLVSVRGVEEGIPSLGDAETISKVEVTVEAPAAAVSGNRKRETFIQLMHPDR